MAYVPKWAWLWRKAETDLPDAAFVPGARSPPALWLRPAPDFLAASGAIGSLQRWEKIPELGLWSLGKPRPGLLENVQPWVALPQSYDSCPHSPASPSVGWPAPTTQSRVHTAKMWTWPWAPSSTFTAVSAERQSPGTHTPCTHTPCTHTHSIHSHVPGAAQPHTCRGKTQQVRWRCPPPRQALCCPECSPLPQSTMGQGRGLPAKGTVPQQVSCARSSSPRPGRDGPLPHRLPEAAFLGLQAEIIHDLMGIGASSQAGLNESLLRRHLEDAVHLHPGPGHLLLARAVGAL